MRTFVGICFLALVALGVPASGANIDYEINFSGSGLLPTSGNFAYDPTTEKFSDFTVVWNGYTFDLTASANKPGAGLGGSPLCAALEGAYAFAMLSGRCDGVPGEQTQFSAAAAGPLADFKFDTTSDVLVNGNPPQLYILASVPAQNGNTANSSGVWTITETPEPSCLTLLFAGLALVALAVRRRGASQSRRVQRKSESPQVSTSS